MKTGRDAGATRLSRQLERASRKELEQLPGVRVLRAGEDSARASARDKAPVVLVSGNVNELRERRVGKSLVYSAAVEFVVLRMPERSIAATISGNASARTSVGPSAQKAARASLKREVLAAAVASAVRRAPRALLAAANM